MTRAEALKEAQRRWGKGGDVQDPEERGGGSCSVGVWYHHDGVGHWSHGCGATWEAAFADAERRQKEDSR